MQRKLLIPPYVAYLDARTARESFMPVFNRARKLAIPVRPFVLQRPLFKKNLKLPTQPNPINTASLSLLSSWLNLLYLRFVGLGKELFKSVVLVWVIWALVGSLQLLQVGFAQLHRSLRAGPLMTAGLLVLHSANKRITPGHRNHHRWQRTWICRVASWGLRSGVSLEQSSAAATSGSRWCFEVPSSPLEMWVLRNHHQTKQNCVFFSYLVASGSFFDWLFRRAWLYWLLNSTPWLIIVVINN